MPVVGLNYLQLSHDFEKIVFQRILCTNVTMFVIEKIIKMLFLKAAPQDLPYSYSLLLRLLIYYLVIGMIVVNGLIEPALALGRLMLNVGITLFFVYVLLSSFNLSARFVQTASAMIGVGIVFNLLIWPILLYGAPEPPESSIAQLVSMLILMLVSWEVLVGAHILRNAMETRMTQAVLLSMALFIMTLTLSQLVFPESS